MASHGSGWHVLHACWMIGTMSENSTDQNANSQPPHEPAFRRTRVESSGSGLLRRSRLAVVYCPRCRRNRQPDSEEADGSIACPECHYPFKCIKCGGNLACEFARVAEQKEVGGAGDWCVKCPGCGYEMNPGGRGRSRHRQVDEPKVVAEAPPSADSRNWIRLEEAAKKYDLHKGTLTKWSRASKSGPPRIRRQEDGRRVYLWRKDVERQVNFVRSIKRAPPRAGLDREPTERP